MAETYDDPGAPASPRAVAAIWSAAGPHFEPLEVCRLRLLERLAVPGVRVDWAAVSDLVDDALVEAGLAVAELVEPADPGRERLGWNTSSEGNPADPGGERITWYTSREGHTEAAPAGRSVRIEVDVAAEVAPPPPAEAAASEESAGEAEPAQAEEAAVPGEVEAAPVTAAAPGEAEPSDFWTPARDLTLVEGFASGDNSSKIAQRLGIKAPDCVRRYRELMPQSGVAAQQRLLKRLRAEAEAAGE